MVAEVVHRVMEWDLVVVLAELVLELALDLVLVQVLVLE
jgi:hypothetical protein